MPLIRNIRLFKVKLVFILMLSYLCGFSQNKCKIDKDIDIPNDLTNKEIRIYKTAGHTNHTGIFRLYQNDENKWKAEWYDHYAEVSEKNDLRVKKKKLKPKHKFDNVWLRIKLTEITNLFDMADIQWKLMDCEIVNQRGADKISCNRTMVSDGQGYYVRVKSGDKENEIYYSNPEFYLSEFPQVDELVYFMELITILRQEFDVLN